MTSVEQNDIPARRRKLKIVESLAITQNEIEAIKKNIFPPDSEHNLTDGHITIKALLRLLRFDRKQFKMSQKAWESFEELKNSFHGHKSWTIESLSWVDLIDTTNEWTTKIRRLFINSILNDFYFGGGFVLTSGPSSLHYTIIDGRQRIKTIILFMMNKFSLRVGPYYVYYNKIPSRTRQGTTLEQLGLKDKFDNEHIRYDSIDYIMDNPNLETLKAHLQLRQNPCWRLQYMKKWREQNKNMVWVRPPP